MKILVFLRRPLVPVFCPSIGFVGMVFTCTPYNTIVSFFLSHQMPNHRQQIKAR